MRAKNLSHQIASQKYPFRYHKLRGIMNDPKNLNYAGILQEFCLSTLLYEIFISGNHRAKISKKLKINGKLIEV